MKVNFGFLLPLAVLAAGAFVAPAQANPTGDRPTVTPTIVAQRGERSMQASQSKPMLHATTTSVWPVVKKVPSSTADTHYPTVSLFALKCLLTWVETTVRKA